MAPILLLVVVVAVLVVAAAVWLVHDRRQRTGTEPRCGRCGYNLTGAAGNQCPECGALFIDAGVIVGRSAGRGHVRPGIALVLALVAVALLLGATAAGYLAERARRAELLARAEAVARFHEQSLVAVERRPDSQPASVVRPPDGE
jgi:uncharacterized protein HemX